MRLSIPMLALAGIAAFSQAPPPSPAPSTGTAAPAQASLLTLPPDTLLATIDGEKVFARDLQTILRVVQPQQQQAAMKDVQAFLEQYALMRRLAGMAEKAVLDQRSPLKDQIAYNRTLTMAQAQLQESQAQMAVKPDEIQKFYDERKDRYTQARIKVIYIPFSPNPAAQQGAPGSKVLSEAEARAKADNVYAQLLAGGDFVKLVKENSGDKESAEKDGDFGVIRRSDSIPDEVKTAVFALKPGEVTKPLRQPNGFYIFRIEETGVQPLAEVRQQIIPEMTNSKLNEWVTAQRKSIVIKIEHPALAPPPPAPAK